MRKRNERCITEQRQGLARPFLILSFALLISHFSFFVCNAQTFTQRIQQKKAGQGTIIINESAEIDQLVNNAVLGSTATPSNTTNTTANSSSKTTKPTNTTTNGSSKATSQNAQDETTEEGTAETTKKIMTGGYKINGYRVQAFAGGNSRKDRQQAESVGSQIKSSFPGVPVYVHFYSPRWICRVGNYRTYEEAHQMLLSLRRMGFTEAVVVKGKITVYD